MAARFCASVQFSSYKSRDSSLANQGSNSAGQFFGLMYCVSGAGISDICAVVSSSERSSFVVLGDKRDLNIRSPFSNCDAGAIAGLMFIDDDVCFRRDQMDVLDTRLMQCSVNARYRDVIAHFVSCISICLYVSFSRFKTHI